MKKKQNYHRRIQNRSKRAIETKERKYVKTAPNYIRRFTLKEVVNQDKNLLTKQTVTLWLMSLGIGGGKEMEKKLKTIYERNDK